MNTIYLLVLIIPAVFILEGCSGSKVLGTIDTGANQLTSTGSSGSGVSANTVVHAGITVTSPKAGTVSSPFDLAAVSSTCSSVATASMGYSIDDGATITFSTKSLSVSKIAVNSGAHVVHVKSWGKNTACDIDVAINVGSSTGQPPAPTPQPINTTPPPSASVSIPSNAIIAANLDVDPKMDSKWKFNHDPGTGASSSSVGTTTLVGAPSINGTSRKYDMTFGKSGGEIYYIDYANDTVSTHFLYDVYVYIDASSELANLEMDMNQVTADGKTYIYGFQCDGGSKTWDYTYTDTGSHWRHSTAVCDLKNWKKNAWHHIQIAYHRDNSGNITYEYAVLDGVKGVINQTVHAALSLNWGKGVLLTNFQLDGSGASGNVLAYSSGMTLYRW